MEHIEVLIGDSEQGAFRGFRARFLGEEIARYEVEDRLVFRLYRCGWGDYDGYRVHKTDETKPFDPKYELTPRDAEAPDKEYFSLYEANEIVSYFPFFAGPAGFLKTREIDPRLGR